MKHSITITCIQCGTSFEVRPYRAHTAKFCSTKCMGKWASEHRKGNQNPMYKEKVDKVCIQCGKHYTVSPYRARTSKFCSVECNGKWKSDNLRGEQCPIYKGGKISKTCEICGAIFEVYPSMRSQRFCSPKCRQKWVSGTQKGENHPMYGKKHTDETRRRMKANHADLSGERHYNWKGGISFEPYCPKFDNAFKETIREKFGRVCFLCGKSEADNNHRKLSVHHVNYNKNCLCDDDITCKFVPLCMSCHAKTMHNREYYEKTIDASIAAMLESKREVIGQITEDENEIGFDLFDLVKEGE